MITEYLIRDDRTGKETWIAAENITEALKLHENKCRADKSLPLLELSSKCWHDNRGDVIHMGVGYSSVLGLIERISRKKEN